MSELLFVPANLLAAGIATTLARRTFHAGPPGRVLFASLAGCALVVQGTLLVLGALGLLTAPAVTAALALASIVVLRLPKSAPAPRHPAPEPPRAAGSRILLAAGVLLVAAPWVLLVVRATLTGLEFGPDGLTYHLPAPAHWLVDRRLSLSLLNFHAYYPMNAELLTLWTMLPSANDAYVTLSGAYWMTLLCAAVWCLLSSEGLSPAFAWLGVACVMASPQIAATARAVAAVDLAAPTMTVAAIAMLQVRRAPEAGGLPIGPIVYSGLCAGFAAGCKASFLPVPLLLAPCVFVLATRGDMGNRRWRPVAAFLVAASLTSGYWYVRNLAIAGNPLYPAAVGPFSGPFGETEQTATKLSTAMAANAGDWAFWKSLLAGYADWPWGLFCMAGLGYGAALLTLRPHRGAGRSQTTPTTVMLLLVGLTLLLLFPITPFSGTNNGPAQPVRYAPRFLVAPVLIGIVLASIHVGRRSYGKWLWIAFCTLAITQGWPGLGFRGLLRVAPTLWWAGPMEARILEVLAAATLVAYSAGRRSRSSRRRWLPWFAGAALAGAITLRAPTKLALGHLRVFARGGPRACLASGRAASCGLDHRHVRQASIPVLSTLRETLAVSAADARMERRRLRTASRARRPRRLRRVVAIGTARSRRFAGR